MKKIIISILIILSAIFSFSASAQNNIATTKDGITVYYAKSSLLKFDMLLHIQVEYRLVFMKKDNEDLGYAFFVNSNYGDPTVSKDKAILFRLSNNEVIRCQAMRDYGEDDKFYAQNATSNAQNQRQLQAYYKVSEDDLNKLMSGPIIKMRVEFDNGNVDLDEKKCRSIPKYITDCYKKVNELKASQPEVF